MKRKWLKGVGLALLPTLALVAAGTAFAHGWRGRRAPDPEKMQKRISFRVNDLLEEIEASDGQRAEINAIVDELLRRLPARADDRRETREAIVEQLRRDRPDAKRLHALVDEKAKAMAELGHEVVNAALQIHEKLTPAQRAELLEEMGRRGPPF